MKENKKGKMKKIKNFIYLDNSKMYSISSQLFEGLTEYIVKSNKTKEIDSHEQKGGFGKGQLMADIMETESTSSEKTFLHHYAYNLFEDELTNSGKVLVLNEENIDVEVLSIDSSSFVKVTGKLGFNDSKFIVETLKNFNQIGGAFAYTQYSETLKQVEDARESAISKTKDRNLKHKLKSISPQDNLVKTFAAEKGLYLDPKFTESMRTILEFGYNGSFDIQMPLSTNANDYLFSALLDRSKLSESEGDIIRKYSRESEKLFTIFGIITQSEMKTEKQSIYEKAISAMETSSGESGMKVAMMNMVAVLTNLENQFFGKLDYEYIIDPVAIYREI